MLPLLRFSISSLFIILSFFPSTAFSQDTLSGPPMTVKTKTGWLKIERLASLSEPWGMTLLPDGRLLVSEKPGRLRFYENGNLSDSISGLPAIEYHGQGGLLDVEVDPQFAQNKMVYIYFVERSQTPSNVTRDIGDPRLGEYQDYEDAVMKGGAVARGRLDGNKLVDVKIIWRQVPKTIGRGHFGGRLIFAPDGNLFISSGDRQRFDPAQSTTSNLGKIIRIKPDGSIPPDNPFGSASSGRDIWSMGHRNPLGVTINPVTKELWEHEMGPMHGDELNIIVKGKNYGWPKVSNGDNYDFTRIPNHETSTTYTQPIYYWHPAISPSGMTFYTGNLFPEEWKNNLLVGSFNLEGLVRLTMDGKKVKLEERIPLQRRIRDVMQARDGSIWMLTDYKDGELIRLVPYGK